MSIKYYKVNFKIIYEILFYFIRILTLHFKKKNYKGLK